MLSRVIISEDDRVIETSSYVAANSSITTCRPTLQVMAGRWEWSGVWKVLSFNIVNIFLCKCRQLCLQSHWKTLPSFFCFCFCFLCVCFLFSYIFSWLLKLFWLTIVAIYEYVITLSELAFPGSWRFVILGKLQNKEKNLICTPIAKECHNHFKWH